MAATSFRSPLSSRTFKAGAAVLGVALFGTLAVAQPAFYLMGNVKPGAFSQIAALSRDGSLAVGSHEGADDSFTWTPTGGRVDVANQGLFYAGLSRDGTTIVGSKVKGGNVFDLIRQPVGGPVEDLGVPSGFTNAAAHGVSANGSSIVGLASHSGSDQRRAPFRWTQGGGFQVLTGPDLSDFSYALDVSDDGRTIVGNAQSLFGGEIGGFVWREGVGESLLPGSEFAEGISANGRFIAGTGNLGTGGGAMLWTDGVPKYLGDIPGWGSEASDVSADGNVVVGRLRNNNRTDSFVWTPQTGMMMARDYLLLNGVPVPSDYLYMRLSIISGDGLSFAGGGGSSTFSSGFVATVPPPSVLTSFLVGGFVALYRRKR